MSQSTADTAFFDHAFSSVLSVIERTRDSIVAGQGTDLDSKQKMRLSREISRLTSLSATAMSLLLMYKALVDGQGDQIDNIPARLEELYQGLQVQPVDDGLGDVVLPPETVALLADAGQAFGLMERIYGMIAAQIAN